MCLVIIKPTKKASIKITGTPLPPVHSKRSLHNDVCGTKIAIASANQATTKMFDAVEYIISLVKIIYLSEVVAWFI